MSRDGRQKKHKLGLPKSPGVFHKLILEAVSIITTWDNLNGGVKNRYIYILRWIRRKKQQAVFFLNSKIYFPETTLKRKGVIRLYGTVT